MARKTFTKTIVFKFTTEDPGIDPDAVMETFREEVEAIDLYAGDDRHDDESAYSIEIVEVKD